MLGLIVPTAAQSQTPNAFWQGADENHPEGSTFSVAFQLHQTTTAPISVSMTVTGTATHGTDYTFGTGVTYANGKATVTVPSGKERFTSTFVEIITVDDSASDTGETIILTIDDTADINLGSPFQKTITVTEDSGTATYEIRGNPYVGHPLTVHRLTDDPDGGVAATPAPAIQWEVPRDDKSDLIVQIGGTSFTPSTNQLGFPIQAQIIYTDGNGNIHDIDTTNTIGPIVATPKIFFAHGVPDSGGHTVRSPVTEGTTEGLAFQVTQNIATATTFSMTVTGTATHGTDYTFGTGVTYTNGKATVAIPAGTKAWTTFSFDITAVDDSASDNGETIILTIDDTDAWDRGAFYVAEFTVTEDSGTATYEIRGDPHVGEVLTLHRLTNDPDSGVATEAIEWLAQRDGQPDAIVQIGGTSFTPATIQSGFPIQAQIIYTDGNGNKHEVRTNTLGPIGAARPRVVSITRQGSSPTAADSLTWRVVFNERVKDVDAADFSLSGSTASLSVSPVSGNANAWDVTASGGNLARFNGMVTLSFASNQDIKKHADDVGLTNTTPTGTNEPMYEVQNGVVTVSPTSLALTELGVPADVAKTYTIVLATDPGADVTITLSNGDATAVAVDTDAGTSGDQTTLTFTHGNSGNWGTAQTVTVRALNDADGANESVTLTHTATAASGPYNGVTIAPVAITTTDAGHGVVVSKASVTVADNDDTATYTVVLKSQPSGNVVITPTAGVTTTATVAPPSLTFTNADWNMPQTVTITGKGTGTTSITHAVSTSADTTNYPTSTSIPAVAVTVTSTVPPGVTLTATGGSTVVSEDGSTTTDTYDLVLDAQPTHDVTVTVSAGSGVQVNKAGGSYASSQTVTFTPSGTGLWSTAQTITVRGVDDSVDNAGGGRDVTLSHATSSVDPAYNTLPVDSVAVRVTDDEATTVVLAGAAGNINEGQTKEITLTLGRGLVDGESLTVPLTFGGTATRGTDYTLAETVADGVQYNSLNSGSATVVFTGPTSGTTATTATLTLSATADSTVESPAETVIIGLGTLTNTGLTNAGGVDATDSLADFTIADPPAAVTAAVTVTPTSLALTELGSPSTIRKTYTLVLDTDPEADVTLTVTNGDATAVAVDTNSTMSGDQNTLTFTHGNWGTAQTVTVRALNDGDGANESFNITHSATAPSGPYNGITIAPVAITTTDAGHGVVVSESSLSVGANDPTAPNTLGLKSRSSGDVVMAATSGNTVRATYTLALKSQPSGAVVIAATSDNTAHATVSPSTVTFTRANWKEPQTVTITGKGAGAAAIRHAVQSSADTTNYPTSTSIPSVAVSVAPAAIPGVTLTETSGSTEVSGDGSTTDSYDLVLESEPTHDVTLTVSAGSGVEVSADGGTNYATSRTLTFTSGTWNVAQTITVRGVDDGVDNAGGGRNVTITHATTSTDPGYDNLLIADADVRVTDVVVERLTAAVLATDAGLTRFGRTVGQQAVDAVRDRIDADRTQGLVSSLAGESLPRIGGDPVLSELPGQVSGGVGFGLDGEDDVTRALDAEDVLTGTSFTLNTMGDDGTSLAFWGEGSMSRFRGTHDGISLAGDVRDIMLGADRSWDHHLVGVLVMGSRGEITYGLDEDTGRLDATLTSLVPYGRRHARDGLTYWGAVGIGWGTMTVTPEGEGPVEGPIDWHMVSGGVEGHLSGVSLLPAARLEWHSDVLWTRTTSEPVAELPGLGGETARVRVGVDATWSERSLFDGFVTPEAGLGLRYDGGDAETGFGLEVRSGLRWRDPQGHLALSVAGRTLAVHEEGSFKDWGVRLGVLWDPHPATKEGFSAAFGYDLGDGVDGDALLGPAVYPGHNEAEGGTSWRSEVAYGVSRGGGLVGSPYGGIGGTSATIDEARVGYRIEPDTPQAENMRVDVWTDPVAGNEEKSAGAGLTWWW